MPIRPCHYFPDEECYKGIAIRIHCEMALEKVKGAKPTCDHLTGGKEE